MKARVEEEALLLAVEKAAAMVSARSCYLCVFLFPGGLYKKVKILERNHFIQNTRTRT